MIQFTETCSSSSSLQDRSLATLYIGGPGDPGKIYGLSILELISSNCCNPRASVKVRVTALSSAKSL
eukprot:3434509-Amphidinium_carterae.3